MKKSLIVWISICLLSTALVGCSPQQDNPVDTNSTEQETPTAAEPPETENTVSPSEPEESSANPETAQPQITEYTAEGYVLSIDDTTMYADLENPGARNYPGEGEDRRVAFDISSARQIQTESDPANPQREHPVRAGVTVSIVYYTENGRNIALELSTNGQEQPVLQYTSYGTVTAVSPSSLTVQITEGDHAGESLAFHLSECGADPADFSAGDKVWLSYYTKPDGNYVVSLNKNNN